MVFNLLIRFILFITYYFSVVYKTKISPRFMPFRLIAVLVFVSALSACGAGDDSVGSSSSSSSSSSSGGNGATVTCAKDYFNAYVYPAVVKSKCEGCHNKDGTAQASSFIINRNNMLASYKSMEGVASQLLLKPTGKVAHGGDFVLKEGDKELDYLKEFVDLIDKGKTSCTASTKVWPRPVLLSPQETLRKASLQLLGRMPTTAEMNKAATESGLDSALDSLLDDPALKDFIFDIWNDQLHTLKWQREGRFPGKYLFKGGAQQYLGWWNFWNTNNVDKVADTNGFVSKDALYLIWYLVDKGKPFSEILTADYILVNNTYSQSLTTVDTGAASLSGSDSEWRPARIRRGAAGDAEEKRFFPHAGVLTTMGFLSRWPSSASNMYRTRSAKILEVFLGINMFDLSDRPVDTATGVANPLRDDPACAVCHVVMDPISAAYTMFGNNVNRLAQAEIDPSVVWPSNLYQLGYAGKTPPSNVTWKTALPWLAKQIVKDPRFSEQMASVVYQGLMNRPSLRYPAGETDFDAAKAGYDKEQAMLIKAVKSYTDAGENYKTLIKALINNDFYRAASFADNTLSEYYTKAYQASSLVRPIRLSKKLKAVMGENYPDLEEKNRLRVTYGGIDSIAVLGRMTEPSSLTINIADQVAYSHACFIAGKEFAKSQSSRLLFPDVNLSDDILATDATTVAKVKKNINHLVWTLWGRKDNTGLAGKVYNSLLAFAKFGKNNGVAVHRTCGTGANTAEKTNHQSWVALIVYMLMDPLFLYK